MSSKNLQNDFILKNLNNKTLSPFYYLFFLVKLQKEKEKRKKKKTKPSNLPCTLQPSNQALFLPPVIKTALRSSMPNPKSIFFQTSSSLAISFIMLITPSVFALSVFPLVSKMSHFPGSAPHYYPHLQLFLNFFFFFF